MFEKDILAKNITVIVFSCGNGGITMIVKEGVCREETKRREPQGE